MNFNSITVQNINALSNSVTQNKNGWLVWFGLVF